ncbi:MAG: LCP family protein [Bacilli bacterium]|nr:LCP family protein [Bacilli bacterium]
MTKRRKKTKINICSILTLISLGASIFLIYNILLLGPIEKMIRYIIVGIIILIDIFIYKKNFKLLNKKKQNKKGFIFLMTIFIIINILIGKSINKIYSEIDKINKNDVTYSSSIITLSTSSKNEIDDLNKNKIGLLDTKDSIENNTIPLEVINKYKISKNNEIVKYTDLGNMLHDLYIKKIDALFIDSNYITMFNTTEEYLNIGNDTKVIFKQEKTLAKKSSDNLNSNNSSLTKPFTILLMGVDSEVEGLNKNSNVHGDSLILITFNPNTLNATMLTIPRDSYVPIVCLDGKREMKLTQAAWYGSTCMTDSIENFLDIKIDYYVKINFKGVVGLVNALGGVDVEVPKKLCTDDSNRWKKVCINKGFQHLDGEGALVLARNRYDLANGDLDRGINQQTLLKAMLQKVKTINSFDQITKILETISNNLDTNLETNQILSFYNIAKDIVTKTVIEKESDVVNIEQLYLQGTGQMIYESSLKMTLWNYVLNSQSIEDVKDEMKINLEQKDPELIKEFSFSINEPFVKSVIGKGPYKSTTTYTLLPNFIGKSKSYVEKWAKENNLKVTYKTSINNSSSYSNNQVISQSYAKNTRLDKIDTLVVTVLVKTVSEKLNCNDSDNLDNTLCQLPSFIGKTKNDVDDWFDNYLEYNSYTFTTVSKSDYPNKKSGEIVGQNYKVTTHLSKVKGLIFKIIE